MKENSTFRGLRLPELYYDRIHPSDAGHTILAHGLVHLLKRANLMLELEALESAEATTSETRGTSGATAADAVSADARGAGMQAPSAGRLEHVAACVAQPLPRPMLPNVAGTASRRLQCHDAESLKALVDPGGCVGWAHAIEFSPSGAPKPGWVATAPGAHCTFAYDLANASASTQRIGIGFLRSYAHMGQARLECVHDCACEALIIDAHHEARISPLDLRYFSVTTRPGPEAAASGAGALARAAAGSTRRCGLRLTVLRTTSSGEHKFKLTALFLNQHGGDEHFGKWIYKKADEAASAAHAATAERPRLDSPAARFRARLRPSPWRWQAQA